MDGMRRLAVCVSSWLSLMERDRIEQNDGVLGQRAERKHTENCCYGFYGTQIRTGVPKDG